MASVYFNRPPIEVGPNGSVSSDNPVPVASTSIFTVQPTNIAANYQVQYGSTFFSKPIPSGTPIPYPISKEWDNNAVTIKNLSQASEGNIFEKAKPELSFDYRSTNVTAKFILGAKIKLYEADPQQLLKTVKEVWIYKKNTQPLNTRSAGCVFKNPRGMSAGAMIDRAGLKGTKIGGAVVSEKHANFIIAEDGCKSSDVVALIEKIRKKVKEKFDVQLELEIEIW